MPPRRVGHGAAARRHTYDAATGPKRRRAPRIDFHSCMSTCMRAHIDAHTCARAFARASTRRKVTHMSIEHFSIVSSRSSIAMHCFTHSSDMAVHTRCAPSPSPPSPHTLSCTSATPPPCTRSCSSGLGRRRQPWHCHNPITRAACRPRRLLRQTSYRSAYTRDATCQCRPPRARHFSHRVGVHRIQRHFNAGQRQRAEGLRSRHG